MLVKNENNRLKDTTKETKPIKNKKKYITGGDALGR